MNKAIKKSMFAVFLLFLSSAVNALELYTVSPLQDIEWTFETTQGVESIQNSLLSKEGGSSARISQALQFNGILFHSYYKKHLLNKAQMNLGFDEVPPQFFWSENNDFVHEADNQLLMHLKCVEVDCQVYLIPIYLLDFKFTSLVGYSFINYSYKNIYNANYGSSFMYNCVYVGLERNTKFNANFTLNYFFTYSPLMIVKSGEGIVSYMNYGAELITNTFPISFTVFVSFRKADEKNYKFIFRNSEVEYSSAEVGFSFHLSL